MASVVAQTDGIFKPPAPGARGLSWTEAVPLASESREDRALATLRQFLVIAVGTNGFIKWSLFRSVNNFLAPQTSVLGEQQ